MPKEELLKLCKENEYSKKDIDLFKKAIDFVKDHLKEKKRLSGEPVINHNIAIGTILAKSKLFPEVVAAGILYGLEKEILPTELQRNFGKERRDQPCINKEASFSCPSRSASLNVRSEAGAGCQHGRHPSLRPRKD